MASPLIVLPEDDEVLLEVSSLLAAEAVTAFAAATETVVAVATGATELETDVGLGFFLAGHAAAVTAETAMRMVWSFMLLKKFLRKWSGEMMNGLRPGN